MENGELGDAIIGRIGYHVYLRTVVSVIFSSYFSNLFTIQLSFLPYFPYLFTIQSTILSVPSIHFDHEL